jgi:hypothetical protein
LSASAFDDGFVIVMVNVETPFSKIVVGEKALAMVGGASTVMLAVAVGVLPNSVVERVTELFFTPTVVPVTSTLNVQLAFVARFAPASEIAPAP